MTPVSRAQIAVSVTIAPPELPVYEQPICPGKITLGSGIGLRRGLLLVPGTWVLAPERVFYGPRLLGLARQRLFFNAGYWGRKSALRRINYGFGYFGHGFEGGRWECGHFFYNRAVPTSMSR